MGFLCTCIQITPNFASMRVVTMMSILQIQLSDVCKFSFLIGMAVVAVGHGLFDDYLHMPPSLFVGIVASVVNCHNVAVLLQVMLYANPAKNSIEFQKYILQNISRLKKLLKTSWIKMYN